MANDLSKPGTHYEIQHTLAGDADWILICTCDSPQACGAIVMALMSAERQKPVMLRIVPRVELPGE